MHDGTMPVFTLYMKKSLCCCIFVIELPIHTLCRVFSNDTDLVNTVTSRAASFWTLCSVNKYCSEHSSHTTEAYSTIDNR